MDNMRDVGTGTPVRLVSPTPVVINATGSGAVRLMPAREQQTMNQPPTQQQGLYGQPTQQQSLYSTGGSNTSALGKSFVFSKYKVIFCCNFISLLFVNCQEKYAWHITVKLRLSLPLYQFVAAAPKGSIWHFKLLRFGNCQKSFSKEDQHGSILQRRISTATQAKRVKIYLTMHFTTDPPFKSSSANNFLNYFRSF